MNDLLGQIARHYWEPWFQAWSVANFALAFFLGVYWARHILFKNEDPPPPDPESQI